MGSIPHRFFSNQYFSPFTFNFHFFCVFFHFQLNREKTGRELGRENQVVVGEGVNIARSFFSNQYFSPLLLNYTVFAIIFTFNFNYFHVNPFTLSFFSRFTFSLIPLFHFRAGGGKKGKGVGGAKECKGSVRGGGGGKSCSSSSSRRREGSERRSERSSTGGRRESRRERRRERSRERDFEREERYRSTSRSQSSKF